MRQKHLLHKETQRLIENFGDWALITGASSGIGLEVATRLAEAGFNLVINARTEHSLQRVQTVLQTRYKVQIRLVAADAGTEAGVRTILSAAENINVGLFIAAAGFGTSGRLIDGHIDQEVTLLRVNCEGLLKLTYYFSKRFALQKRGGIVLLSSMVAFQGVPFAANYAASKAYVQSLAEALAVELRPFNVTVLAAAPGPVESGFGQRADINMNLTLKPEDIGVPILKALGKKTTVLPGLLTKILAYSLRTVPRSGKVSIMGKIMQRFTRHQQPKLITK